MILEPEELSLIREALAAQAKAVWAQPSRAKEGAKHKAKVAALIEMIDAELVKEE